ncbi:MAG TPA: lipid-transfer protein, partial [Acidimicrobiia bacterium]|nr:lipid-transfer protein [Acidimicrobiia bacterium]
MTRTGVLPRDAVAIAGMGQTEFSRAAGRTELQLASEAIVAACADAQIDVAAVDGLVSYTIDPVEEAELVRSVGLVEIGYSARVPYGGGGSMGVLMHAAAAVAAGVADVVVVYRAVRARTGATRFGGAKIAPTLGNTHAGTTASQWCTPHGLLTPASWIALN